MKYTKIYKDNVQTLCDSRGLKNPIEDDILKIAKLIFRGPVEPGLDETFVVKPTPMNKAGRLFVQDLASGMKGIVISVNVRADAAQFFTKELWDDCSAEKQALVFGMKHYRMVEIVYE